MNRPTAIATPPNETTANSRRVPGRPRSEKANSAIMRATLELLDEGMPLDALSVEAVAARAGVGKATVYRRWPNKYAMVAAALASLNEPPAKVSGRSVREDLTGVLRNLLSWISGSLSARVLPNLLNGMRSSPAIRDEYHRVVLEPRMSVLRSVLTCGIQRRELDANLNVELAVTTIMGIAVSTLLLPPRSDPEPDGPAMEADRIVDLFLLGAGGSRPCADPS